MISSHSSGFMRSSRLSRVMPALLTSTVGAPSRPSISFRQGIDRVGSAHVQHQAAALEAAFAEPLSDALRTGFAGRRADHRGAAPGEFGCDRPTDAARCTGHERDSSFIVAQSSCLLRLQVRPVSVCGSDCRECVTCGARNRRPATPAAGNSLSSIASIAISLFFSMRRLSPVSTRPGPHSTITRAPRGDHGLDCFASNAPASPVAAPVRHECCLASPCLRTSTV